MIYTVIAKVGDEQRLISLPYLPDNIREKIEKTKNGDLRKERLIAYNTLSIGLDKIYGINSFCIENGEHGKPFLVTNDLDRSIFISLSHSRGVVSVCLTDEGEIGVDIQAEINGKTEERIKKRFFSDVSPCQGKIDCVYYRLGEDGELIEFTPNVSEDQSSYVFTWSACEAILKCHGNGFVESKNIEEMMKTVSISSCQIIEDNIRYYISIAVKKEL